MGVGAVVYVEWVYLILYTRLAPSIDGALELTRIGSRDGTKSIEFALCTATVTLTVLALDEGMMQADQALGPSSPCPSKKDPAATAVPASPFLKPLANQMTTHCHVLRPSARW